MLLNDDFAEAPQSNEPRTERKMTDSIMYGSKAKNTEYDFIFIKTVYDLNTKVLSEDKKTRINNPNLDVVIDYQLPKPVDGYMKVMGLKTLVRYKADEDVKGADGKVHTRAGAFSAYYDKKDKDGNLIVDKIYDACEAWKNANAVKKLYRRGTTLPVLVYLKSVQTTVDGVTERVEVNEPALIGMPILDAYFPNQQGMSKLLLKYYTSGMFEKMVFTYSPGMLMATEPIDKNDKKIVDKLKEQIPELMQSFRDKKALPMPYDTFMSLVEAGKATIEMPEVISVSASKSIVSKDTEENIVKRLAEEFNAEVSEDDIPF